MTILATARKLLHHPSPILMLAEILPQLREAAPIIVSLIIIEGLLSVDNILAIAALIWYVGPLIAVAGRMAKMYIAETRGTFQPEWSIDDVDAKIAAIRDKADPKAFGLHGHVDHLVYSFGVANGAKG